MKGIILAGGTGSRLYPLTKVTNKHLLPVGNQPMIYYPVKKLIQAGIHDILIVTGREHMGAVVQLLGSGHDFGAKFTYRVQDEAGGIAQALLLAEDFAANGPITVILGDNIFQNSLLSSVQNYTGKGAQLLLKQVPDPERFGVATLIGDTIDTIVEKPKNPTSNLAITGIYMYDATVFDRIRTCQPSGRGELEISDVNAHYLRDGSVRYSVLNGWWSDAGTVESLQKATQLSLEYPVNE
ncbi:MAG: sugar phosphate nucleotidyltransferase [Candidatus Marinamargulisbacteria bacterium]